jgi:hypothetical protein
VEYFARATRQIKGEYGPRWWGLGRLFAGKVEESIGSIDLGSELGITKSKSWWNVERCEVDVMIMN